MSRRRDHPDRREWSLESYEVNYLHLDYRFGFDLSGFSGANGYLKVIVNVPFRLRDGTSELMYEPEDVMAIGGALKILHKLGKLFTVYRNGTLEVKFQDDLSLTVEKHPQYESWEAHGDGELAEIRFLCSPHPGPPWQE